MGVFTDGEHVFVADSGNHRILVWLSMPKEDGQPADLVLGQPTFFVGAQNGGNPDSDGDGDFDANRSTLHYPSGVVFDGRLYVADTYNHRVLVWNGLPMSNGQGANHVLGQPDFRANDPNRGLGWWARGASTLARPVDVEVLSAGRIAVSDSHNNRVMIFGSPDDAPAVAVIGQPDFVSDVSPNYHAGFNVGLPLGDTAKTATAATLRNPWQLAWTGDSLLVADRGNHRALEFPDPLLTHAAATAVWGQPDFETRASNEDTVSADSLDAPHGIDIGAGGQVLIADTFNNRLLQYDGQRRAMGVFGQTRFHENGINGASPAFDSLRNPAGIALEPDGARVWVADRSNHRVIAYVDGEPSLVLGQPSDGGSAPNAGFSAPREWTFAEPTDVWTDGLRLVVADRGNHRVLIWHEMPKNQTDPADVVVGQPDLSSGLPNLGVRSAATDRSLFAPEGVFVSADDILFVADTGNNRILVFDQIPTANGTGADRVICQGDFRSNGPNRGTGRVEADRCAGPTDVTLAGGHLWVADARNNRVLRFGLKAGPGSSASMVLGQPGFESRVAHTAPSASSLFDPVRVEFAGGDFYVVDRGNNRVLIWDSVPTQTEMPADRVLGQKSFDTAAAFVSDQDFSSPFGLAVLPRDFNSANVWVSDAGRNRVIVFDHVARPF